MTIYFCKYLNAQKSVLKTCLCFRDFNIMEYLLLKYATNPNRACSKFVNMVEDISELDQQI